LGHLLAGASSCGCFGNAVTMPPAAMFTIDMSFAACFLLSLMQQRNSSVANTSV
jgi:hypothetical protein